jgi:nucleoside-triphosphatase THEP1
MTPSTDTEAKLTQFGQTIILHPQYAAALETMHYGFNATRLRGEPCSTLLLGEPGTGKSTACTHMISLIGGTQTESSEGGSTKLVHAFECVVPATYSINDLCTAMLKKLGDTPPVGKLATLQNRLFRLLITCETKLIIIDDIHDLLNRGAEKTCNNVCKWIKYVANTSEIPIMLSGKEKAQKLIDENEELAGRYPYRALLSNLQYDEIFKSVLRKLNMEMNRLGQFTNPLHITDNDIAGAIYLHTNGNMREIRTLLYGIMLSALSRDDRTVTRNDCILAANIINENRPNPNYVNPFEQSWTLLEKKIKVLPNA